MSWRQAGGAAQKPGLSRLICSGAAFPLKPLTIVQCRLHLWRQPGVACRAAALHAGCVHHLGQSLQPVQCTVHRLRLCQRGRAGRAGPRPRPGSGWGRCPAVAERPQQPPRATGAGRQKRSCAAHAKWRPHLPGCKLQAPPSPGCKPHWCPGPVPGRARTQRPPRAGPYLQSAAASCAPRWGPPIQAGRPAGQPRTYSPHKAEEQAAVRATGSKAGCGAARSRSTATA